MYSAKKLPGDLVIIMPQTHLRVVIGNEELYSESLRFAVVIATSHVVVEKDDEISGYVIVFVTNMGLYVVDESLLLTPDEYRDPSRLFPISRLSDQ